MLTSVNEEGGQTGKRGVGGHEGLAPLGDGPAVTPGDTWEAGIQH